MRLLHSGNRPGGKLWEGHWIGDFVPISSVEQRFSRLVDIPEEFDAHALHRIVERIGEEEPRHQSAISPKTQNFGDL